MEPCKTQLVKAVLRENNKARGIMLPDFKMYYKAIILEIVQYWHKNRQQINQHNQRPQINPQL